MHSTDCLVCDIIKSLLKDGVPFQEPLAFSRGFCFCGIIWESNRKQMIYIPGNVPSSKNSKQWTGRRLIESKPTRRYRQQTGMIYKLKAEEFRQMVEGLKPPYQVEFRFIRDSKRRFDYHNAIQIVADMMVEYGWIEDDNADYFLPVFLPYEYKKNDGGVYIGINKKS